MPDTIKPTYFHNRITAEELRESMVQRKSFFLEDVEDVDATAQQFALSLQSQGLVCQVRDHRESLLQDGALYLSFFLAALLLIKSLIQSLAIRMAAPTLTPSS